MLTIVKYLKVIRRYVNINLLVPLPRHFHFAMNEHCWYYFYTNYMSYLFPLPDYNWIHTCPGFLYSVQNCLVTHSINSFFFSLCNSITTPQKSLFSLSQNPRFTSVQYNTPRIHHFTSFFHISRCMLPLNRLSPLINALLAMAVYVFTLIYLFNVNILSVFCFNVLTLTQLFVLCNLLYSLFLCHNFLLLFRS